MQKLSTDVLQFVENHVFNVTELVHSGKLGQILDTFAETKNEAIYIVQSDGKKSAKAVIVDLEFFKELLEYREAVESAMDEHMRGIVQSRMNDPADVLLSELLSETDASGDDFHRAYATVELDDDE